MRTQTIDVPLYSPGPSSSSDLQREKMNLTVGSIGSHSFVGAAASHNGTLRCEWECKVCVYILTESSGLVLISRCRLLVWRLRVQRSAKGQTPAKKRQKPFVLTRLVCYLCILTVHGCNLTSLMQLEQIPRKIVCRCVQIYIYIYIYASTHRPWAFHKPPSAADAFHVSPLVWKVVEHGRQGATILLMLQVCISNFSVLVFALSFFDVESL